MYYMYLQLKSESQTQPKLQTQPKSQTQPMLPTQPESTSSLRPGAWEGMRQVVSRLLNELKALDSLWKKNGNYIGIYWHFHIDIDTRCKILLLHSL